MIAPGLMAQQANLQVQTDSKEQNLRAYVELLRADIKSQKVQIFTDVMRFDEQQTIAFWPIYREYDLELSKLGDERLAIITDYANNYLKMTDAKADELAKKVLELDDRRSDLKKKYYERFNKALSPVMAVRFFQVENQIQLLLDLQIASNLPIIEETGTN